MKQEIIDIATAAIQRYAEMHPRPPHVNMVQAGKMLELSHMTVRKLVRSGAIKMNECGQIPVSEIDRVIAARS